MDKNEKLNILLEGQQHGIAKTCKKYDISRTLYYRWFKRYEQNGIEGLSNYKKLSSSLNVLNVEIEATILNLIQSYPLYGPRPIKYLLDEIGYSISETAVFNMMKKHNLTNRKNRMDYVKKKTIKTTNRLPSLNLLESGNCLVFWITDYGTFDGVGRIYEYTILDIKSHIACTRLYKDISYRYFEDLLISVAIPVAQSLHFNMQYLCFFSNSELIAKAPSTFMPKITKTIKESGYDLDIQLLNSPEYLNEVNIIKNNYTQKCLSFILSQLNEELSFTSLKETFQQYILDYNTNHYSVFDAEQFTPIQYHNQLTHTKSILPLWAYIHRPY